MARFANRTPVAALAPPSQSSPLMGFRSYGRKGIMWSEFHALMIATERSWSWTPFMWGLLSNEKPQ